MRLLRSLWRWFDDLTGTSRWLVPVLEHPVPPARRWSWLYVFGSATLLVFVAQVITGISLASGYVASSARAYETLQFITDAPLGRIVRGIHYYGASAMIILVGVHAMRVYLMGSYKYPRQMNWITGAILLLLTLGMSFTGQLLRWDQTGFWSAVIAAEQAGRLPVIGSWLGHFVLAGDTAGGATLSRFFAAHVFFVAGLIFLVVGFHLYLVLHNGISEPPVRGVPVDRRTYRRRYAALLASEGEPFWPDAAWRDATFGFLVIATIVALAVAVGPPALGKPPDPTILDASPRPDWYFLWYYALLSVIPPWTEDFVIVLGPLVLGLVLFLLPLVSPGGERSPLRRPWAIALCLAVVAMIAYYGALGHVAPWSPRFAARPLSPEVVRATAAPVLQGATLFHDKGCQYCHTIAGSGGIRGPDLTDVGDRLTGPQIATRIYSGAGNMPSYTGILTHDELAALVAFLETRQRHPPAPPALPPAGATAPSEAPWTPASPATSR